MAGANVDSWRHAVRFRIDGQQFHYDGVGEHSSSHATVFQSASNGRRHWKVEILAEIDGDRAETYTFGDFRPLTLKMAKEIAERFVTGRKIPKRLDWR